MDAGKVVTRGVMVIVAIAVTSYVGSTGAELTNAADDLSVAAGAAILLGLWAAWSYAVLRFLLSVAAGKFDKKGEQDEESS